MRKQTLMSMCALMAGSRHAQNAPGKVIEVCFVKLEMLLTFFHLQNTHLYEHTLMAGLH